MNKIKNLFIIISFLIIFLIGCTGKTPTPSKQDFSESIDENIESTTSPEIDYDPELLSYISVEDGFHIADYGKSIGTNYTYAVFNMRTDDEDDNNVKLYWEIVVMQENNVITVLHVDNEEHGDAFPTAAEIVVETDVNFDGKNDILICLGHFGNQGAVNYKCYLTTEAGLVLCPSFAEIANPSIDYANQVVRSQWRNSATSHGWGIFNFMEGKFIETERLTEDAAEYDEAGVIIWSWRVDIFSEGEWQTKEYFTQKDFDTKTIESKLYGPDSYWGLDQPKWNTLFNQGKMLDFSIYGN